MDGEYGIRWREFVGRSGQLVTKEKFFRDSVARDKFVDKLTDKDGFVEILAWCEPRNTIH